MSGAAYENRLAALEEALMLFAAVSTARPQDYESGEREIATNRLMELMQGIEKRVTERKVLAAA